MRSLKDLLIIIPAKEKSNRLKNKNIYNVKGKKLIEYTLDLINEMGLNKNCFISTDSKKIIQIVKKNKLKFILRPKKLSNSKASTESVIIHSIKKIDPNNQKYKWVLTLQLTSPLRSKNTLKKSFKLAMSKKYDSIISLTVNRGYFWLKIKNGQFKRYLKSASRRQQERNNLLEETGSVYLNNIKKLIKSKSVINGRIGAVITKNKEALDINDINDIEIFKSYL
tara:strand:+ start:129 stop:800 length:672 start_codon:yes stop_codon:yes gene_type:complete